MPAKTPPPPESSVTLRVICGTMSVVAISASFLFGQSATPMTTFQPMEYMVIMLCVLLVVAGGWLSYYHRDTPQPAMDLLTKIGAVLIIANLARELWVENLVATEFQFLKPLLHALVAASILTSFELRTRNEINSSAAFGLFLMVLAASSGKSIFFGAFVIVYICLGAILLFLSCRSQSRAATPTTQPLIRQLSGKPSMWSVVVCLAMLPVVSLGVFSFLPRLDAEADSVTAHVRALATTIIYDARQKERDKEGHHPAVELATDWLPVNPVNHRKLADEKPEPEGEPGSNPANNSKAQLRPIVSRPDAPPIKISSKPALKGGDKEAVHLHSGKHAGADSIEVPPLEPPSENQKPSRTRAADNGKPQEGAAPANSEAKSSTAENRSQPTAPKQAQKPQPPSNQPPAAEKQRPTKNTASKQPQQGEPKVETQRVVPKLDEKNGQMHMLDDSSVNLTTPMNRPEDPLFTLACNRSVYTTLTSLDYFDGQQWSRTDKTTQWVFQPTEKGVELAGCWPLMVSEAVPVVEVAENFHMDCDLGPTVPIAGVPEKLSLLEPTTVDAYGAVTIGRPLEKGTDYTVISMIPVFSPAEMRSTRQLADPSDINLKLYTQVPADLSADAIQLAQKITGSGGNRFVQAQNIVDYLRKNCTTSQTPCNSLRYSNKVDDFLFDSKKGDCKDFASAFIMLCRASGIPARLVVGFVPGDFDAVTGLTHVKQKHGHAWAEIYMAPYGWIGFDPVPGGLLPARPDQEYYNYERIRKELANYSHAAHTSFTTALANALRWFGYAFAAIAAIAFAFALKLLAKAAKPTVQKIWLALKPKHPATRIRNAVINRLRKLGVEPQSSDTTTDLLAKLQKAAGESHRATDLHDIEHTFNEFIQLYNSVYFGQEERLPELKETGRKLQQMIK